MSAIVERTVRRPAASARLVRECTGNTLAATVIELVRLAGGRVSTAAFEPAALILIRAGAIDGDGVTFGCDYDLRVYSRELRRGYTHAVDARQLTSNGDEIWLGPVGLDHDQSQTEHDALALAQTVFGLPREELARRARHLLLAE